MSRYYSKKAYKNFYRKEFQRDDPNQKPYQRYYGTTRHPKSLARKVTYHEGYEIHSYLYTGKYGHWRVWKIVDPEGNDVDNRSWGNMKENNCGPTAQSAHQYAAVRIDAILGGFGYRFGRNPEQIEKRKKVRAQMRLGGRLYEAPSNEDWYYAELKAGF